MSIRRFTVPVITFVAGLAACAGTVAAFAQDSPASAAATAAPQTAFTASVVHGSQVYACTRQPGGGYAFTQDNVAALLQDGIRHSFVKPGPAGPPQWVAPDGSSVSGTLITKIPNGTKNIAELVLAATQTGKPHGLLSRTTEVLRLNTVGGVAPAGSCNPATQPIVKVPYHATYVFIGQ